MTDRPLNDRSSIVDGANETGKAGRFPWIAEERMSDAQRSLAATLGTVSGGATSGPQSFLLRSPKMAERLHELIHYLLGESPLPRRLAELAILIQAKSWDQPYEWWAHHHLALRHGVDPSVLDDIAAGRRPGRMTVDEAAVYDFCMELSTTHRVGDASFDRVRALIGEQGLADLTVLSGIYTTIAMILNVAEEQAPLSDPLPFAAD